MHWRGLRTAYREQGVERGREGDGFTLTPVYTVHCLLYTVYCLQSGKRLRADANRPLWISAAFA